MNNVKDDPSISLTGISQKSQITEVLYGNETLLKRGIEFMQNVNEKMDMWGDKNGPSIIINISEYINNYIEIKKRGGKIRYVTEITTENLSYCKEIMKVIDEFRHLDGIKGAMTVSEREFIATTKLIQKKPLTQGIYSNVREVVEQGQYIFDSFWSQGIPAIQRIRELEKGLKREFIEIIRDPIEIQKLLTELLKSTIEEISILFSFVDELHTQTIEYIASRLREILTVPNKISVKILIHKNSQTEERISRHLQEFFQKQIEIKFLNPSFQSKSMVMIFDKMLVLAVEKKDFRDKYYEEKHLNEIGMATYSNSESTVASFEVIFENLWIQGRR
jgi:hypothetical protein